MSKYLRLGFHLSWISVLLILLGFLSEIISEKTRFALYTGDLGRPGYMQSFYIQQDEIIKRELLWAKYMAQPLAPLGSFRRGNIIDRGLETSLGHLDYLIENAPTYFPELSIEAMETTKNKIQLLIDEILKDEFKDNINSIRDISNQITLLQKEVMDYENQAINYNEKLVDQYEDLSVLSRNFSTRIVLIAFFINVIIFSRLQWLEYKTERRIQGLLE